LVLGRTEREHDERLNIVLSRLEQANLSLNSAKCELKKTSVKYVGHIVSAEGISADPEKVNAIKVMQPPSDITGVRSFLGMVAQLSKFTPTLAEHTKPIRDLLSTKNQFYWGPYQQTAFDRIKQVLTSTPVLALYDPKRYTVLATNAISFEIGHLFFQRQDNGDLKPVSYGSRALSPTEQRYSTIEKEALGSLTGAK
jgi:hypothetical protein